MASCKKLKEAYLAADNSKYAGFRKTEYGFLKVTALPCTLREGNIIGDLIISEVRVSRKESQAFIIANEL